MKPFNGVPQDIFGACGGAVSYAQPDHFGRTAKQGAPLGETGIVGHNHELILPRESPNLIVGGAA
jgi:hypothetical protein